MSAATHVSLAEYLDYVAPEGFEDENRAMQQDDYPQGSPQLAIEVFSPDNRPGLMQKKVTLYLDTGAFAVWIAYPKRQTVVVHDTEGEREYRDGEDLLLPAPLPETPVAVRKIFETS